MILVADSGSTKTHWMWGVGNQEHLETVGLNPHFVTDECFCRAIDEVYKCSGPVDAIYFYSAGCGSELSRQRIMALLCGCFPMAQVSVETDLLAACRATCGDDQGLVGILGTGSNACFYDGYTITERQRSLGYILGDEGSGCHVGKQLVRDYLMQRMPLSLSDDFGKFVAMGYDDLMHAIYENPAANRFFAAQVPFAAAHRSDSYMHELLISTFEEYLRQQVITKHRESPLHLVGGVAATFKEEIEQAANEVGCRIGKVMLHPIAALATYHFNRM